MELPDDELPKDKQSAEGDFQFLTFTDFSQTTHPETKRRIRSHAMHRVQRSLRAKRQEKNVKFILDVSPLMDIGSSSQSSAQQRQDYGMALSHFHATPHPSDLGSGRVDPFKQYPIDMDLRMHELFDHLHGGICPVFRTMSKIGFFNIVADEAGFRQILCSSSAHMTQLRNGTDSPEAIVLSTQAIRSLNRRLAAPVSSLDDGIIAAILTFACHAVMFNDLPGLITHLNGLVQILQQKGGIQILNPSPVLRIMLFWVDVNAAFLQDLVPRFLSPLDILPPLYTNRLTSNVMDESSSSNLAAELVPIFEQISLLNEFILRELGTRDLWDDGVFCGLQIVPILHQLLSVRFDIEAPNPAIVRQEFLRICAIIYLAKLRQKFGVNLALDIYIAKLKRAVIDLYELVLGGADHLLLWGLIISGLQSFGYRDHAWFVSMAAVAILHAECESWNEVVNKIGQMMWVQQAFDLECDRFRQELSDELWVSYEIVFL
ncbi:hypothetical protein B7463_g11947, partial [Scytalidium lignicola]